MIVYRLHRDTRQPFEYNFNKDNRWNPARVPMLYCASSIALCCLEVLVHTDPDLIPDNYVWSWVELPALPEVFEGQWDIGNVEQTRQYGKYWIDSRRSLALAVPSVIVPHTAADFNVLLNPTHEGFFAACWRLGGPSAFDPRLFLNESSV